ncbi:MAG: SDR family oxidoreductase [Geodermatophilaceae bacterium]|nr:SDR family oxidoreductase [Geodermatophilaceae bacterium]
MQWADVAAVVTGGASGLGEATTRALSAKGAAVTILDLQVDKAAALVAELGGGTSYVATDVTDGEQVQAALAEAVGKGRELRVAVNCAGVGWASRVLTRDGTPHDLELFSKVIGINLIGTFNVLRLAAVAMAGNQPDEQGERGAIVNTASIAAFDGQIAYAASKAGVAGMTLPAARDLSSIGVRVNTVAPGIIDTPMLAGLPEDTRAKLAAGVPFPKRLGTPADYASLAVFLLEHPYLNGETVRMDAALRMPPK